MSTRSPALRRYRFEGHAIVSADDRIADANGAKTDRLNHPADWARFQGELDKAVLILIGRKSHEAEPAPRPRNCGHTTSARAPRETSLPRSSVWLSRQLPLRPPSHR